MGKANETSQHSKTTALRGLTMIALGLLAVAGLFSIGADVAELIGHTRRYWHPLPPSAAIPISVVPGPLRDSGSPHFELDDANSVQMTGRNSPWTERWADLAGNFYAHSFVSRFSYEATGPNAPVVRVRVSDAGPTFAGRIEARNLKPNFVYQIKLRGDYRRDPTGAEAIGYVGRWRLPGKGTNYTDADYEAYADKAAVEAYILFDFFVTDKHGNATRDFALDSSLHVLWNAARQRTDARVGDVVPVQIDARDPTIYVRPKQWSGTEQLWAERERGRYQTPDQVIRLPAGNYQADLILTEESFHSNDRDGGFWPTPFTAPVRFEITPQAQIQRTRHLGWLSLRDLGLGQAVSRRPAISRRSRLSA